jgi:hypothetical protein
MCGTVTIRCLSCKQRRILADEIPASQATAGGEPYFDRLRAEALTSITVSTDRSTDVETKHVSSAWSASRRACGFVELPGLAFEPEQQPRESEAPSARARPRRHPSTFRLV